MFMYRAAESATKKPRMGTTPMTGIRRVGMQRLVAVAAADRIKLLLQIVENDDFLHEVLNSAHQTVAGSMEEPSQLPPRPTDRTELRVEIAARTILDKKHQEAKESPTEAPWPGRHRLN
jgi:hypothetical protein